MSFREQPPLITFNPPIIRFTPPGPSPVEEPLSELRRFVLVTCFEPEVAPAPDPTTFDLLDFGQHFWLVPDGSAERYLSRDWAAHLQSVGGYFEANADALPSSWRASFLGIFKHQYNARAAVVPAEPTPFFDIAVRSILHAWPNGIGRSTTPS